MSQITVSNIEVSEQFAQGFIAFTVTLNGEQFNTGEFVKGTVDLFDSRDETPELDWKDNNMAAHNGFSYEERAKIGLIVNSWFDVRSNYQDVLFEIAAAATSGTGDDILQRLNELRDELVDSAGAMQSIDGGFVDFSGDLDCTLDGTPFKDAILESGTLALILLRDEEQTEAA
jgi:hypothetical protein